jgi:hypothetical protein
MNNPVKTVEEIYIPLFNNLKETLAKRYPFLIFKVSSTTLGATTSIPRHVVSLECTFPQHQNDMPEDLGFDICIAYPHTSPRIMAYVTWGYPSGRTEASLSDELNSYDEWPHLSEETMEWLTKSFPDLCQSFENAVKRGYPLELKR